MKKLLSIIILLTFFVSTTVAQKFVYGDLKVTGNAYVTGSVYSSNAVAVPYLNVDSVATAKIKIGLQRITYATGDSIIDNSYVNTNYTGALTDGAPTSAEIVAVAGTAASKGAGFKAVIKDSNGTALYYLVISTGAAWYYYVGTLAL
jgi:hypothetical protein